MLALSGLNGAVQTWNVADGSLRTLKGYQRTVQSLAFLDSTTLVSGAFDGTLVVWDARPVSSRDTVGWDSPARRAASMPDRLAL